MAWLWNTLYLLFVWFGVLIVPLGLPGTFLIAIATAVLGWQSNWTTVTVSFTGLLFGLALLGEIGEQWLGLRGAQRRSGTKAGMWGTVVGGLIGAIVGVPVPVIGGLLGAMVGAFVGATLGEWLFTSKGWQEALQAGYGAFLGKVGATLFKTAWALGMAVSATLAVWSPYW